MGGVGGHWPTIGGHTECVSPLLPLTNITITTSTQGRSSVDRWKLCIGNVCECVLVVIVPKKKKTGGKLVFFCFSYSVSESKGESPRECEQKKAVRQTESVESVSHARTHTMGNIARAERRAMRSFCTERA